MKRIMIALLLTLASFLSFSQKKQFDLFGVDAFHFGMTEAEAISVLDKLQKKHELEIQSRLRSIVVSKGFTTDPQPLLDGTVDLCLDFKGSDVLKNNRKLYQLRLIWMDWYKRDDRREGSKIMKAQLEERFGYASQTGVTGLAFWKNIGEGHLYLMPFDFIELKYSLEKRD